MAEATIPVKRKTKSDFDLNIYSQITAIYGKISYDEAISILNNSSTQIITILKKNKKN